MSAAESARASLFAGLIATTGVTDDQAYGLIETPVRAARAWGDLTSGYDVDVSALFKRFEGVGYDELVLVGGIPVYSLCEHHLLPFVGKAAVGYLPGARGEIVGLSKIVRVVDAYARRLQVQERLTQQIAQAFTDHLEPRGVIVVVRARHFCMELRGVKTPGAVTTTSVCTGSLREKPEARAEALHLIGGSE